MDIEMITTTDEDTKENLWESILGDTILMKYVKLHIN